MFEGVNNMKKLLVLLAVVFVLTGCSKEVDESNFFEELFSDKYVQVENEMQREYSSVYDNYLIDYVVRANENNVNFSYFFTYGVGTRKLESISITINSIEKEYGYWFAVHGIGYLNPSKGFERWIRLEPVYQETTLTREQVVELLEKTSFSILKEKLEDSSLNTLFMIED